jgi:hypothetical protein
VIWVRLVERNDGRSSSTETSTNALVEFPEGGYAHLRARLTSKAGGDTVLPSTGKSRYFRASSEREGHVEGWLLPGSLDDQLGSVIQIESARGIPIGTLDVR